MHKSVMEMRLVSRSQKKTKRTFTKNTTTHYHYKEPLSNGKVAWRLKVLHAVFLRVYIL